jgi:hypothetical protein
MTIYTTETEIDQKVMNIPSFTSYISYMSSNPPLLDSKQINKFQIDVTRLHIQDIAGFSLK